MNIFVDDERARLPGDCLVARTASDFEKLLQKSPPTIISLDQDLGCDPVGDPRPSWHDCVPLLIEAAMDRPTNLGDPKIIVPHSASPVDRANMSGLIEGDLRHYVLAPVRLIDMPVDKSPSCARTPSHLRW